jgi:hypothetical protein
MKLLLFSLSMQTLGSRRATQKVERKMKQSTIVILSATVLGLAVGCAAPKTFVRTVDPGWNTIEIREGVTYDEAWTSVVDLLARKFDLEVLSKEDGYLRTGWLYTWTGEIDEDYKVRGIVKFSPNRSTVEVKSEAQHFKINIWGGRRGSWEMGTDERLVTTLRTDIMGKVGRVSR